MATETESTRSHALAEAAAALQHVQLRLGRRLRKHSEPELSLSQMSALTTLQRLGAMRVGDLARREQISKSSATKLVFRLEEMGYLSREVDPTDARSYQVEITIRGNGLLTVSTERANEYLAGEIATLDEAEQKALLAAIPALQRLVAPRTH